MKVFIANFLWFLSCLPELIAFIAASFLKRRAAVPAASPVEYEDLQSEMESVRRTGRLPSTGEPVLRLVPTSGTSGRSKWIPYTGSLLNEMRRAFDAWVGSLYWSCPSLLFGRHYWSLSPNTEMPEAEDSTVPLGFGDDVEYLRPFQRRLMRELLVVPAEVSRIRDPDVFNYLTLLFMARESNLRLISVWHPSFLTLLLDSFTRHREAVIEAIRAGRIEPCDSIPLPVRQVLEKQLIADPARADALSEIAVTEPAFAMRIWPRMRVISCWTDGHAARWVETVRRRFPGVVIQGKGIVATEGVVSFPLGLRGRRVSAVRSHSVEFEDVGDGRILSPWEATDGAEYSVLLTTGGGLNRYRLHDVVRVEGFFHRVPCLRFLGRDNQTSDLVGEKLNIRHAELALDRVQGEGGVAFRFAMLAPARRGDVWRYVLYLEPIDQQADCIRAAELVEADLCRNYHYRHARRRGQLDPVAVRVVRADASAAYRCHLVGQGMTAGDVKFPPLSLRTDWDHVLGGQDVG